MTLLWSAYTGDHIIELEDERDERKDISIQYAGP